MSATYMDVSASKAPMRVADERCTAVLDVLNLVGDKWSILIVVTLEGGTQRFSELQRNIEGISQRMLVRTLRELERFGLVSRAVEPTIPPSVYYALTSNGKTLLQPLKLVAAWAIEHAKETTLSKQKFDKKRDGLKNRAVAAGSATESTPVNPV